MKRFRPLQGEILLRVDAPKSETDGGIALLETPLEGNSPSESVFARVVRLGNWKLDAKGRMIPFEFRRGDRVLVNSGSGRWVRDGTERLKLVPSDKILAVVEK